MVHSRTSIGIKVLLYSDLLDFPNDLCLTLAGRRGLLAEVAIVGRACDFQNATQHRDRPSIAMLVNELEPQPFSLAKNAVAFFKMSRSTLS